MQVIVHVYNNELNPPFEHAVREVQWFSCYGASLSLGNTCWVLPMRWLPHALHSGIIMMFCWERGMVEYRVGTHATRGEDWRNVQQLCALLLFLSPPHNVFTHPLENAWDKSRYAWYHGSYSTNATNIRRMLCDIWRDYFYFLFWVGLPQEACFMHTPLCQLTDLQHHHLHPSTITR